MNESTIHEATTVNTWWEGRGGKKKMEIQKPDAVVQYNTSTKDMDIRQTSASVFTWFCGTQ
jgi:hypothetical protein